jgi:hypothetical protein
MRRPSRGATTVKRIKYISRFAEDLKKEDIDTLVDQAEQNNAQHEITGILVTAGHLFFQIIEGPSEAIDTLFHNISNDQRHTDVLILAAEDDVPHRIFPDWSLKKLSLDNEAQTRLEPLRVLLETTMVLRKNADSLIKTIERAIWTEAMRD